MIRSKRKSNRITAILLVLVMLVGILGGVDLGQKGEIANAAMLANPQVGDVFPFGRQEGNWVVLAIEDGAALLVSQSCLIETCINITGMSSESFSNWVDSFGRNNIFTEEQQERLVVFRNSKHEVKISLLSYDEYKTYIFDNPEMIELLQWNGEREWARRSDTDKYQPRVFLSITRYTSDGTIYYKHDDDGSYSGPTMYWVRPAIWLSINDQVAE